MSRSRRLLPALLLTGAVTLAVTVPAAGANAGTKTSSPATGAAASSHGKGGPLTPRLQKLSHPGFAALPAQARAQRLGLAASGPGSIVERPGGRIQVDIRVSDTSATTLRELRASGAQPTFVDRARRIVTAEVTPARLDALAAVQPQVLSVEEDLQPIVNAACPTGDFVSEGDTQLNAATGRTSHSVDGTGVTVGVLSDSYNRLGGAPTDVTNGELPGTGNPCGKTDAVTVQADHLSSGADEGRAMAQIVHDLAPGADLRFATAFNSEGDFAQQIRNLAAAGAKTIVDDITYFDEPMYQDGVIGAAVEDVTAQGVTYFSSAGNENTIVGGHDVGSYEAPGYRPTTCPASVVTADPGVLDCHNFNPDSTGAPDNTYGFSNNGSVAYVLGWNEPQFGITTDLDLCIINHSTGAVLGCSAADNLQTQKAFESLSGTLGGSFDIVVARFAGTATPRFKLISWRSALTAVEYPTSSGGDVVGPTIFGHNASRSGATVAAIPYNDANTLEPYSSKGPATYCWGPVNGTTPAPALPSCETASVDMSATDGVQNSFFGGTVAGVHRFFGTSAAAPHAAAIAALIEQERPCMTPAQVMSAMTSTAHTFGTFGSDAEGAGRLDADAALAAAAAAVTCDSTPPLVTVAFSPPTSGWFTTSPATGTVTADDTANVSSISCTGAAVSDLSGIGTTEATATLTVSAEGGTDVSCTATDGDGNDGADPASANTATVQIDTQEPSASPTAAPSPNGNGWNNSDVTVTWNWTDPTGGSGIDTVNCTTSSSSTGEGTAIDVSASCADVAGNTATADWYVNVDKTAPTLSPSVSPNPVILGGTATATAGASDSLSGVASQSCGTPDTSSIGTRTVSCTATDKAGNTTTQSVSYTVGAFFGSYVSPLPRSTLTKSTSTIPVKFTLRDANGPLSSSASAALAGNGQVRAMLSGPGSTGPTLVTATCTWNTPGAFFQCNLKTPKGLQTGTSHPYLITAQEKGTSGPFFNVPGPGNPETVYFK